MRTLALAVLTASLLPACLRCGFEGEGDTLYTRGSEQLMVCANGGFVFMGATTYVEGRTASEIDGLRGATGETGALAFQQFAPSVEGTSYASPELGSGWTPIQLDETDLDHAHILCADLEARAWWPNATTLPATTTFARVNTITLAVDGTATVSGGGTSRIGSYSMAAGEGYVSFDDGTGFTVVYAADGMLWVEGTSYTRLE